MPDTPVIAAPTEPSIAELRSFLSDSPAPAPKAAEPAKEAEPVTEIPDPETDEAAAPGPVDGENAKTESGPVAEETEAIEEELPENVRKRIAKEVERQSRADRAITEAISSRKAAEDKLAKLTADKSGSEPAPTTAPAATPGKPVRPDLDTFAGTYAEYQAALNKYDADHEAWLIAKTERTVEDRLTAQRRDADLKKDWDSATEQHGADFPELMKTLAANSPEELQLAISGLDDWSAVAAHLAKSPGELKALAARFKANPYAAVADLGRLEARLQQESKSPEPAKVLPAKVAKPLPPPPAKPGGAATATVGVDFEKADQSTFNREMAKLLR